MVATIAAISTSILIIDSSVAAADDTAAQRVTDVTAAFYPQSLDAIIAEASQRFGVPESWKIVRPIWVTKPVSPENRILVAGKLELLTIIFLVKTPSRPTLDTNQNIE